MVTTPEATFNDCLTTIGFNDPTKDYLVTQGFSTLASLTSISLSDLDKLIKHAGYWRPKPTPPAPPIPPLAPAAPVAPGLPAVPPPPAAQLPAPEAVMFPFLATRKLKALHQWGTYRKARGSPASPIEFTTNECELWMQRIGEAEGFKAEDPVTKPPDLKDLDKWPTWEDLLLSWLRCRRSSLLHTPMVYLVRKDTTPTAEQLRATYESIDDDLVLTVRHVGEHYRQDNQRFFDDLKTMMINGPAWPFVQKFNKKRDGRAAYFAVKEQAEGQTATATRRAKQYAILASTIYNGRGNFTISKYVGIHTSCHNELFMTEEEVAETKKVTVFLENIKDPRLTTAKQIVNGDPAKLGNFQLCQQFISTCAANAGKEKGRNISLTKSHSKGFNKNKKRKRDPSNGPLDPKKRYSNKEFRALDSDQKAKLRELRLKLEGEDDRAASAATTMVPAEEAMILAKRLLAISKVALSDDKDDEATASEEKPPKDAGKQFGRAAHKKNAKA